MGGAVLLAPRGAAGAGRRRPLVPAGDARARPPLRRARRHARSGLRRDPGGEALHERGRRLDCGTGRHVARPGGDDVLPLHLRRSNGSVARCLQRRRRRAVPRVGARPVRLALTAPPVAPATAEPCRAREDPGRRLRPRRRRPDGRLRPCGLGAGRRRARGRASSAAKRFGTRSGSGPAGSRWRSSRSKAPTHSTGRGKLSRLTGVARGEAPVRLQKAVGASGWQPVRRLAVSAAGRFDTAVRPTATTRYRLVAGETEGPAVEIRVRR